MKKLVICLAVLLSGCSLIPSKWDVNQARVVVNVHQEAVALDCSKDVSGSLTTIASDLNWLHTYSEYKGTKDLDHMTGVVQKTVSEFQSNVAAGKSNAVYCQLKKALIIQQTDIIGHTFEGSLP